MSYFKNTTGKKSRVVISGFSVFYKTRIAENAADSEHTTVDKNVVDDVSRGIEAIPSLNLEEGLSEEELNFKKNIIHLARGALKDARLNDFDPCRTDVIMGSRRGLVLEGIKKVLKLSHAHQTKHYGLLPAVAISDLLGTNGYVYSSPTTSIMHSLGNSYGRIQNGLSDVALAGETDVLSRDAYFSVSGSELLAGMNQDTYLYSHFEKSSESGIIFVLEDLEFALSRGAKPYIEIESYEETYSADYNDEVHNGAHAGGLIGQVMIGLLSIVRNEPPEKISSESWSTSYVQHINFEMKGNEIKKVFVGGLTGTGLHANLTLKSITL